MFKNWIYSLLLGAILSPAVIYSSTAAVCFLPDQNDCVEGNEVGDYQGQETCGSGYVYDNPIDLAKCTRCDGKYKCECPAETEVDATKTKCVCKNKGVWWNGQCQCLIGQQLIFGVCQDTPTVDMCPMHHDSSVKDSNCWSCNKCIQIKSVNYGKYKCVEQVRAGYKIVDGQCTVITPEKDPCEGYDRTDNPTDACHSCTKCENTKSANYGKYKCVVAPNPGYEMVNGQCKDRCEGYTVSRDDLSKYGANCYDCEVCNIAGSPHNGFAKCQQKAVIDSGYEIVNNQCVKKDDVYVDVDFNASFGDVEGSKTQAFKGNVKFDPIIRCYNSSAYDEASRITCPEFKISLTTKSSRKVEILTPVGGKDTSSTGESFQPNIGLVTQPVDQRLDAQGSSMMDQLETPQYTVDDGKRPVGGGTVTGPVQGGSTETPELFQDVFNVCTISVGSGISITPSRSEGCYSLVPFDFQSDKSSTDVSKFKKTLVYEISVQKDSKTILANNNFDFSSISIESPRYGALIDFSNPKIEGVQKILTADNNYKFRIRQEEVVSNPINLETKYHVLEVELGTTMSHTAVKINPKLTCYMPTITTNPNGTTIQSSVSLPKCPEGIDITFQRAMTGNTFKSCGLKTCATRDLGEPVPGSRGKHNLLTGYKIYFNNKTVFNKLGGVLDDLGTITDLNGETKLEEFTHVGSGLFNLDGKEYLLRIHSGAAKVLSPASNPNLVSSVGTTTQGQNFQTNVGNDLTRM